MTNFHYYFIHYLWLEGGTKGNSAKFIIFSAFFLNSSLKDRNSKSSNLNIISDLFILIRILFEEL